MAQCQYTSQWAARFPLPHVGSWTLILGPVEPAALHAAAKNIIYFTALAVLRGAPAFCIALQRQSTDSVRREQSTLTVIQRSRRRSFSTSRGSARQSS